MSTINMHIAGAHARVTAPKASRKAMITRATVDKTPSSATRAGAAVSTATTAIATLASAHAAHANEVAEVAAGAGFAIGGAVVLAGAGAALVLTDPSKRRETMMSETGGDEAASVRNYFDTTGF